MQAHGHFEFMGHDHDETAPYEIKNTEKKFITRSSFEKIRGPSKSIKNKGKNNGLFQAKLPTPGTFRHCFVDEAEKKCYMDSLASLVPITRRFCVDCNVD